ncbi:hypothetical protein KL920_002743 [Ogataea angusta]|nr:hypothetical protein KL920_002743 [Ogataea angusta]
MVKFRNHTLDLGYPIYGAKFVSDRILVVAGGGGEGNNGIPNKITALLIQPQNPKKPIKRYRELVLNEKEDCPMSLDANSNQILVGINENSESIRRGVNKHLRKFKYHNDHLKFVESCQIHPGNNPQHYQKLTKVTKDATMGIIAMSDEPSSLYIVDMSGDLEEKFKIVTVGDVKDISISPDGKMMCYVTSSHFEAISTVTGRSIFKSKVNFSMSKIEFYDNNMVIIAGSSKNGVVVGKFSIAKSAVTKSTIIDKTLKGITSMDTNNHCGLIALGGSDCSVLLVRSQDLKLLKKLDKVHGFAITRVVFSENGDYLASVSAANTVNIIEIPSKLAESKPLYLSLFQIISSVIVASLIAFVLQYLYVNGYIEQIQTKAVEYYRSKQLTDSSAYFTIQPIASSEVFLKGPSSTITDMPNSYISTLPTDKWAIDAHEIREQLDTELSEYTFPKPVETFANKVQTVCSNVTRSVETNGHQRRIVSRDEPRILEYQSEEFLTTSGKSKSSTEIQESTKTLTVFETVVETQTSLISSTQISTTIATVLTTEVKMKTETVYLTFGLHGFSNPTNSSTHSSTLMTLHDAPHKSKNQNEGVSHNPSPSFHKNVSSIWNVERSGERFDTIVSDENCEDPQIVLNSTGLQKQSAQPDVHSLNLVSHEGQSCEDQNRTQSAINDHDMGMIHEETMGPRLASSMGPEITADVKHSTNCAFSKPKDYLGSLQEPGQLNSLFASPTNMPKNGEERQVELEISQRPYTLDSVLPKAFGKEDSAIQHRTTSKLEHFEL